MSAQLVWNAQPRAHAKIRLFVFPHAGGMAAHYKFFQKLLPYDWELMLVEMPGRGRAQGESFCESWNNLKERLSTSLKSSVDRPSIFFGHSMGAIVAYECLKTLVPSEQSLFFASAMNAPDTKDFRKGIEGLSKISDDEFVSTLADSGGIPIELLENRRLLNFFLPDLRRDFDLLENYEISSVPEPLKIPVVGIYPEGDFLCSSKGVENWKKFTSDSFKFKRSDKGHFYVFSDPRELVKTLIVESLSLY
jgi:medium-chain acyl-[acyl-carrier-protein] hydrolase